MNDENAVCVSFCDRLASQGGLSALYLHPFSLEEVSLKWLVLHFLVTCKSVT